MAAGIRNITTTGQIGDGREAAAVDYVLAHAGAGNIDDVLATIDKFAYEKSMLINVGDEKGTLLDAAVRAPTRHWRWSWAPTSLRRAADRPGRSGGQGVLRRTRRSQRQQRPANMAHAGVDDRVVCVVGTIGDGGRTLDALTEHGFATGTLDFVFLDHDKKAYLPDLQSILDRGWLHPGSIVVADNVRVPGAPKYRAYMRRQQGMSWNTIEHKTHLEYQTLVPDLVLESEYLG